MDLTGVVRYMGLDEEPEWFALFFPHVLVNRYEVRLSDAGVSIEQVAFAVLSKAHNIRCEFEVEVLPVGLVRIGVEAVYISELPNVLGYFVVV